MKKIYFLLIGLVWLISQAQSQNLLTEGFEGTFPPTGWAVINAGSGNDWNKNNATFTDGPYAARTGTGAAIYEYHATNNANAWMITSGVSLTAGTSYTISFYYRIRSSLYPEKLKVTVGNAQTVGAQSQVLWNNNGGASITNTAYTLRSVNFTTASTGTYYFGFNAYSDANQWAIQVDDVSVDVTPGAPPTCTTPTSPADGATNVTMPAVNFSWNAAPGATSYDFYFGSSAASATLLGNVAGTSATVTVNSTNTTYYWYVVPKNAAGAATGCVSSARSFTTENVSPPSNDECAVATTLTAYMGGPTNAYTINGTASTGITACATDPGTADEDVWFKFTALQNGSATITVIGASTFDAVVQGFSGSCGSLVQVGTCADLTANGGTETLTMTGLTAGQTYYLRVYDYSAGVGDRFTIQLSGTALPVTFAEFTGRKEGNLNLLSWKTVTESNNKGFELQRSADGKTFSTIAHIASKAENGNSTSAINYAYTDARPLSGNNYYRLKQVDKDGRYSYSDIVVLKAKASDFRISSIYPNPAVAELNLVITSTAVERATIVITDLSGKAVSQISTQLVSGDNMQQVNVRSLSTGTYMIKVVSGSGIETAVQRFVKN